MSILKKLKAYSVGKIVLHLLIRYVQRIRAFYFKKLMSDLSPNLKNVNFIQPAQFVGKGIVELSNVTVGVWPSPYLFSTYAYFEARNINARIIVGEGTFLNNGACLIADKSSIEIGSRCLIGVNFSVTDSDFHGLEPQNRNTNRYECCPVKIGNNVFIGNDVKILKGVTIGDGAVIGAGSIVLSDVSPLTVHAGVPARFIKNI